MGEALFRDRVVKGWIVAGLDVQEKVGEALAKELGPNASFYKCNIADYDDQARVLQSVFNTHGRIDALLANAGIVDRSSVYLLKHRESSTIPPKPDTSCTDVDFKAILYGVQLSVHFMRQNPTKSPCGKIIATASVAGIHPHSSYPEYCGAKAAVVNFCRSVAPVLKVKDNINVNVVLPGIVPTKIIPQSMLDAVSPENLTPVDNIVRTYDRFLNDDDLYDQVVECSAEKQITWKVPEFANGKVTKRACTVWDPLFKMMHGENSGLEEAIPEGEVR